MNKKTATNKFLAQYGRVIEEMHKDKKQANKDKIALMQRKQLNDSFTSPIGVTKKSHYKSPAQRKRAKFSRRINREE